MQTKFAKRNDLPKDYFNTFQMNRLFAVKTIAFCKFDAAFRRLRAGRRVDGDKTI
jgi:hypothetical protein